MSSLSQQEIEDLTRQLKEKTEEIKLIYNKLVEGGVVPLPEDILASVAGGTSPSSPALGPIPSIEEMR